MVKLESKLPGAYNGVEEIAKDLLENPKDVRVAIIFFDCPKITRDTFASYNAEEPTIRIRRIEPIFGDDEETVKEILLKTYEARAGVEALPFDAEADAKENGTKQLELSSSPGDVVDEPEHGAVKAVKAKTDSVPFSNVEGSGATSNVVINNVTPIKKKTGKKIKVSIIPKGK